MNKPLPPGRELDALIAEKVFGLSRIQASIRFLLGPATPWFNYDEVGAPALPYSTEIAALISA